MKINLSKVSLALTLLIHLSFVIIFKLLDSFSLILAIYVSGLIIGFILNFYASNNLKNIGWGMFYGSLFAILSIGSFMIWLIFNYPK